MATTPEGRVKAKIRDVLNRHEGLWQYWPVPSGYGRRTVDVIGCFRGFFFAIEAKRDGEEPTELQREELLAMRDAGGVTFVIAGEHHIGLASLESWLQELEKRYLYDPHIPSAPSRRRSL
jgi:hypothetical protein